MFKNSYKIVKIKKRFPFLLLLWNKDHNKREMPWKGEKDPYRIWLSEVILQQTRVEQGLSYYNAFIQRYPAITDLAAAPDTEVMKLWEGLGYYSRCRNLLATARQIVQQSQGQFPSGYDQILQLKGVGPYTAAAIASFAFNQPYAVVDGNVFRVLARVFNIPTPIDSLQGKKRFTELAQELLDVTRPGEYNQAIMDFGATICKPALPLCHVCPVEEICQAKAAGRVNELPVKEKTLQRRTRYFTYLVLHCEGMVWVEERKQRDIWQGLYQFYLVETGKPVAWTPATVQEAVLMPMGITGATIDNISASQKQQLTHQTIHAIFIKTDIAATSKDRLPAEGWKPVTAMEQLAFPRTINDYLQVELQRPAGRQYRLDF